MGAYYINYYFHNIEYDDGFYGGEFSAPDYRVYCKFLYDRETKEFIDIWDNTQPIDEILPIPIWWLDNKLEQNGKLGKQGNCVSTHLVRKVHQQITNSKLCDVEDEPFLQDGY